MGEDDVAIGRAADDGWLEFDKEVVDFFSQFLRQCIVVVAFFQAIQHGLPVHFSEPHAAVRGHHVATAIHGVAAPMLAQEVDEVDVLLLKGLFGHMRPDMSDGRVRHGLSQNGTGELVDDVIATQSRIE
ncbi:hypothetical protein JL05_02610 [Serratia nematodiphila DZ0503SBS1]|nr:hypothetical protein JL05_02610 [Serratia nematodiphila DZ0503SBS1]OQV66611.1 hypothetical protein AK51_03990 [Serratia nematodiphila DZ0503SBS1]